MTDLITFLTARLTELARSANSLHSLHCSVVRNQISPCDCGLPDFVIREIDSQRSIVIEYGMQADVPSYMEEECGYRQGLEFAVQTLAQTWSDHSSFRSEWVS